MLAQVSKKKLVIHGIENVSVWVITQYATYHVWKCISAVFCIVFCLVIFCFLVVSFSIFLHYVLDLHNFSLSLQWVIFLYLCFFFLHLSSQFVYFQLHVIWAWLQVQCSFDLDRRILVFLMQILDVRVRQFLLFIFSFQWIFFRVDNINILAYSIVYCFDSTIFNRSIFETRLCFRGIIIAIKRILTQKR